MITKEARQATVNAARFHRVLPIVIELLLPALEFPGHAASTSKAGLPPEIVSFIEDKETQARALAKKLDLKVSDDVWAYFARRKPEPLLPSPTPSSV